MSFKDWLFMHEFNYVKEGSDIFQALYDVYLLDLE